MRHIPPPKLALIAVSCITAVLLLMPRDASAGSYQAIQCDANYNSGSSDAVFTKTSDNYLPGFACTGAGGGMLLRNNGNVVKGQKWAAWSWYPPTGTVFTKITSVSHVAHDNGHKANFTITDGAGNVHTRWPREGVYDAVDWAGGNDAVAFTAWLACHEPAASSCAPSAQAHTYVRALWFTFRDWSPPAVSVSGELLEPGPRRGSQLLTASANDLGGGISQWTAFVNGVQAGSAAESCDNIPGGAARRFVPCPLSATESFSFQTDKAPWRQGANEVRVCASDFGAPANTECVTRTVVLDNACPTSGSNPAGAISASFDGGRSDATVPSNRQAQVTGRLSGAGAGARICVFETQMRDGVSELAAGEVAADPSGRFTYTPPRGPSRRLRFVYRHDKRAVEAELVLRSRVKPRLKVGPRSRLQNGQVARFRGKLPGPAAGGRVVVLQAKSGKRWQAFKSAETTADGRFRARYRFRGTTARRLYRFRAVVREQSGYPYAAGASPVRRVVVTG